MSSVAFDTTAGLGQHRGHRPPTALTGFLALCFIVNVAMSVALVKWQIATIPVRSIFSVAALAAIVLWNRGVFAQSISQHAKKFLLIAAVAVIGILVSLAAGNEPVYVLRQVLEIHVQAGVTLALGVCLVDYFGVRPVAYVLIAICCVSGVVGVLQYFHIDAAWTLREYFGEVQQDRIASSTNSSYRDRAVGLSMNSVLLATHLLLAFAAFWAVRLQTTKGQSARSLDTWIVAAIVATAVLCVTSGNRSPLLGLVAFSIAYALVAGPAVTLALVACVLIAFPLTPLLLGGEIGLRVANTDDGSAVGRAVLQEFGWRLFLDKPLGHGLQFSPVEYWPDHWEELQIYGNSQIMRVQALHNYFLNCLNKYGVMIIVVGAYVAFHFLRRVRIYLPWLAYIAHIAFHNDGPLQSDFLFWYVLALFPAALPAMEASGTVFRPRSIASARAR